MNTVKKYSLSIKTIVCLDLAVGKLCTTDSELVHLGYLLHAMSVQAFRILKY